MYFLDIIKCIWSVDIFEGIVKLFLILVGQISVYYGDSIFVLQVFVLVFWNQFGDYQLWDYSYGVFKVRVGFLF